MAEKKPSPEIEQNNPENQTPAGVSTSEGDEGGQRDGRARVDRGDGRGQHVIVIITQYKAIRALAGH